MNKFLTSLFIALFVLQCAQAKRLNCFNPESEYFYHIKDSENFGTEEVEGIVSDVAYKFQGEGQYRDFGSTNIGDSFSVSFWVKTDEYTEDEVPIINFGNGFQQNDITISYNPKEKAIVAYIRKGSKSFEVTQKNVQELNVWYHFAVVYADGGIQLYVNGKETGVTVGEKVGSYKEINRKLSYIGKYTFDTELPTFNGTIDDLALYNKVLTKQQIECLADICEAKCGASCSGKSDHCEASGDETAFGCPLPIDSYINQVDLTNEGVKDGESGPVSNTPAVFDGTGFLSFDESQVVGGAFSVSMWVKIDESQDGQKFFDFGVGETETNNIEAGQQGDNEVNFAVYNENKRNDYTLQFATDIGNWHYYVFTSDTEGKQQIYRDGKPFGKQSPKNQSEGALRLIRHLNYVGKSNDEAAPLFKGQIDDFKVYSRVLNQSEVACAGELCNVYCVNGADKCPRQSNNCGEALCVQIFSECDFQGEVKYICQDEPDLDQFSVASIYVPPSTRFTLYKSKFFKDSIAYFTESVYCLKDIEWDNPQQLKSHGIQLLKQNTESDPKSHLRGNKKTKQQIDEEKGASDEDQAEEFFI